VRLKFCAALSPTVGRRFVSIDVFGVFSGIIYFSTGGRKVTRLPTRLMYQPAVKNTSTSETSKTDNLALFECRDRKLSSRKNKPNICNPSPKNSNKTFSKMRMVDMANVLTQTRRTTGPGERTRGNPALPGANG
jgi:hypothetical protein